MGCVIGIDIGGTHFRIGAVDEKLQVHHFRKVAVGSVFTGSEPLEALGSWLELYLKETGVIPEAMVLGFPATVNRERTRVLQAPNLPQIENLEVTDHLSRRLGIPILLERDVNLALCFDRREYIPEEAGIVVGCYFGTGLGNAVMIDGRLLVGRNGTAGELGHIPVAGSSLLCGCGNPGCMEAHAGGSALLQLQQTHFPDTPLPDLFARHDGHPVLEEFLEYMAMAIATEVNILDPDYVLIGGGIPDMEGFPWEKLLKKTLLHTRKPYPAANLRLLKAPDHPHKGVIGAALYARSRL